MKKLVGVYALGDLDVRLCCRDGFGGEFSTIPKKNSVPEIVVGFESHNWQRITSVLLHEAFELEMHFLGLRYDRSNDYGNDHSGYIFIFNHPQFSDVCGRVGVFLANTLADLCKHFRQYEKDCKAKERKKKKGAKS
jgi:hypothetical protein